MFIAKLLNKTLITVFFTVCLLTTALASHSEAMLELEGLDGKQHELGDYIGQGKWTILNIWGAKCPPCRAEMPDLVDFHDQHKDTNAIVVGIAIDFPSYGYAKKEQVKQFAEDYFIDFPIFLSDSDVTDKLGLGRLDALPTTYLYTPEGKLVGMQVGAITKALLENYINSYSEKQE